MNEERARFFLNRRIVPNDSPPNPADQPAPVAFHQRLPGYAPTPLIDVPDLARQLGIGQLLVKSESSRFGLPAFKILGASWAIYRALEQRLGHSLERWQTIEDLANAVAILRPLTLATATDGNHGRAVAHMARLLGLSAKIFVPAGTAQARIEAIAGEGAAVEVVNGTYDDAVARAAREEGDRCMVVSDTSWPGYERIPRWVMEGYATIFCEIDDELGRRGEKSPDLILVQVGVGALAAAVVRHYRAATGTRPKIVSVEPLSAACMLESMEAGRVVEVPGPHHSIMAGLNCGRPSLVAWPIVSSGVDLFLAIPDQRARQAMRALGMAGVIAGETGAAGLAGLLEIKHGPEPRPREWLGLAASTRALVLVTEGATDPASYRQILA